MILRNFVFALIATFLLISCQSKKAYNSNNERIEKGDMAIKNAALNSLHDKLVTLNTTSNSDYLKALNNIKSEYDANQYLMKNFSEFVMYYENKHKNYWIDEIGGSDLSSESKNRILDRVKRNNRIEDMLTIAIWNTAQNHNPSSE